MDSPRLSIVIPSYNKVKYIDETLESVVSQGYPNLEIIVQDGGSTDGTLEIIKKFAREYPNIFIWESKKDKGQLDAINRGLGKSTGDIVTYINADDVYIEGTFLSVSKAYSNNPDALWFAGKGIVINDGGKEIAHFASLYKNFLLTINHYSLILIVNYLMQPSVFFTKEAYKIYGPFIGTKEFVMEYDLWLKLGKIQMPVLIKKVLTKFRIEPGTKTKTGFRKLLMEDMKIAKKYSNNQLIFVLHHIHNLGRKIYEKIV